MSEKRSEKTDREREEELIRQLGWSTQEAQNGRIQANRLRWGSFVQYLGDQLKAKELAQRLDTTTPRRPIRTGHVPRMSEPNPGTPSTGRRPIKEVLDEISRSIEAAPLFPISNLGVEIYYSSTLRHFVLVNKNGEVVVIAIGDSWKWPTKVDMSTH